MGAKGSAGKVQSIKFPLWMSEAIEKISNDKQFTFTDVVIDFCRQELAAMGITMGIGREATPTTKEKTAKKAIKKAG